MTLGTFSETHLFRYLCNIYYVASIVLGPRDTMLNGTLIRLFNVGKVAATLDTL